MKDALNNANANILDLSHAGIHNHGRPERPDTLSLANFEHSMVDYFGEFEAKRITQYLKKNDIISVSFPEFFRTANTLFNEDLDEIISQCFEKLDLSDVGYLSVKYIR